MSDTSTSTWPAMTERQRELVQTLREHGPQATVALVRFYPSLTTDAMGKACKRLAERGILHKRADGRWMA